MSTAPPKHCRAVKTRRPDSMTGTLWRDMPACRDQNVPVVAVHQREGGPDGSAWITHRFLLRFQGEPA